MSDTRVSDIFTALGAGLPVITGEGLSIASPWEGAVLASLPSDTSSQLTQKTTVARTAQQAWAHLARRQREEIIEAYAAALKSHRELLASLVHLEAGKTPKEALGEVDGAADVLLKTIRDATLPELNGMLRTRERPPVGLVGLITSFNFPIAVAHWTLAPAFLAGNAVLWKPSEKTPLVALACKAIFDKACPVYRDLLQLLIGGREIGEAMVKHEQVDLISATGSVAMGHGIRSALATKPGRDVPPILELGGNNGVIISQHMSKEHLAWSCKAILSSFLGTTGQRCTNTRRIIVHRSLIQEFSGLMQSHIEAFLPSVLSAGAIDSANDSGYGALIDEDAFRRFEQAKAQVAEEGGEVRFGKRLLEERYPQAWYVEPALAILPAQRSEKHKDHSIMYKETFAPILFIAPYDGDIKEAIALVNAPSNAGLVNGIYTQNRKEAELFAALNQAGHSLINSPKGTGTPAYGMGFGGNKDSGEGEILNAADPLAPFTRPGRFRRIAWNKETVMND